MRRLQIGSWSSESQSYSERVVGNPEVSSLTTFAVAVDQLVISGNTTAILEMTRSYCRPRSPKARDRGVRCLGESASRPGGRRYGARMRHPVRAGARFMFLGLCDPTQAELGWGTDDRMNWKHAGYRFCNGLNGQNRQDVRVCSTN